MLNCLQMSVINRQSRRMNLFQPEESARAERRVLQKQFKTACTRRQRPITRSLVPAPDTRRTFSTEIIPQMTTISLLYIFDRYWLENTICICACSDNGWRRVTLNLFCLKTVRQDYTVWLWSVTWPRPLQESRATLCHMTGPVYHTHVFQTRGAVELRRPHTPEAELQLCCGCTLVPGSSHFLWDSILTVLHAAILQARRCTLTGRKLCILSHVLCGHFYDLLVVLLPFQCLMCVKFHFLTPSVRKN